MPTRSATRADPARAQRAWAVGAPEYLRTVERIAVGARDSVANGMLPGVAVGLVLAVGGRVVLALSPANRAAEGEPATGATQAADAG